MTAQYLLRFDDLCPAMDRARWARFRPMLRRYRIRPILAVVPDNRDPELKIDPPDPEFWNEMRALQAAGATIGLHGYRHLCQSAGTGLVPLHKKTEFAGVARETQREWIRAGIGILRGQGLEAKIWVAPRHGLDAATLEVLREEGIGAVSDGFAARPFRSGGMTWIPQQLWAPAEKKGGLWTICMHSNTATDQAVAELESFLCGFAGYFTSVEEVLAGWPVRGLSLGDWWFHQRMLGRMRLRRLIG